MSYQNSPLPKKIKAFRVCLYVCLAVLLISCNNGGRMESDDSNPYLSPAIIATVAQHPEYQGGTGTFTVKLLTNPGQNAVVTVSTPKGSVSPASLTFGSNNYDQSQTVTITG